MDHNKLSSIEKRVCLILENHPQARENDRYLIWQYYQTFYMIRSLRELALCKRDIPCPDSITRLKRKVQALGLFPASEKTKEAKGEVEKEFVLFFGKR